MNIHHRRLGRLSAGTVVGSLITSGLLLAASPAAHAVTTHFVRADQVDLVETRATGHNDFSANGRPRLDRGQPRARDKAAGYFLVNKNARRCR